MKNADKWLLDNRGVTVADLENAFGFRMTWYEDIKMKKNYLVPTEIHANFGHTGAVANYKYISLKVPDISGLIENEIIRFGFQFGTDRIADATIKDQGRRRGERNIRYI